MDEADRIRLERMYQQMVKLEGEFRDLTQKVVAANAAFGRLINEVSKE